MSDKKLHNLEEAVWKKDLNKMRKYIKVMHKDIAKADFDAKSMFSEMTEREFCLLREWPSLIMKASSIFAKTAVTHFEMSELDYLRAMYDQVGTLYLLCRQGRSMGATVECLKLMINIMFQIHSMGGNVSDLDTSMIFKKGFMSENKDALEGGIEL